MVHRRQPGAQCQQNGGDDHRLWLRLGKKLKGCGQHHIKDLHDARAKKRAGKIVQDTFHPAHHLFKKLSLARGSVPSGLKPLDIEPVSSPRAVYLLNGES